MSKKALMNKINKRSIRTIRKTLGAICLITAIIVAAVPIPDLEAIGGVGTDKSAVDVLYTVSDNSVIVPLINSETDPLKITKSSMLYELSDGTWRLDWAYEYFMDADGYAVISKYNSDFKPANATLNINVNMIKEYPQYTSTQISDMFTNSEAENYRGLEVLTPTELALYYPTEYKKYTEDLAASIAHPSDPVTYPVPTPLGIKANQLSTANKLNYFCYYTPYLVTGPDGLLDTLDDISYDLSGYSLVEVKVTVNPTTTTTAYIPKLGTEFFVALADKVTIKYIGDNAFEGATFIENVTIPKEILQVGNNAFKNCSSLKSVNVYSDVIGNHAFEGCSSLQNITIEAGTTVIGTEAFRNCNSLGTISFPSSVIKIGEGAFAYCGNLRTVNMSGITATLLQINDFAFYDCYALNTVDFSTETDIIGLGAFAVQAGVSGTWTSIKLPNQITKLEDYIFSGRSNLKEVTMPSGYGSKGTILLGSGFFKGCINLNWVEFPVSCGFATFGTNAFIDVITESFYVRGPEKGTDSNPAAPRLSARAAGVPYVFTDSSGKENYEAGNGSYLFLIDSSGNLQSCTLLPSVSFNGIIEIPSVVGDINIIGIAEKCFSEDPKIKSELTDLIIQDNSVTTIAAGAFEGYPNLANVQIGNSVNSIGANAFKGCEKLTEVHFNTPKNGYTGFTIGTDAFATSGESLTFYGDIDPSYAPFTWAMGENNFMNFGDGTRVCYKTNAPTSLTVMKDNETGLVTLLDYPHYEQISSNVITAYETYVNTGTGVISASDLALVRATQNIAIPAGIESIDTAAYMKAIENSSNIDKYLLSNPYYATYRTEGLFNGYYGAGTPQREYPDLDKKELVAQGNDRILSVTMVDVQYLPDNAFYSCENLQVVSLGADCKDIGVAPFAGCTSLGSIAGNTNYSCENGIIYSNNTDGSKNIVECLSGRGSVVGEAIITEDTDSLLSTVTTIAEGAFQDCIELTKVDLSAADDILLIPKNCFDGCSKLGTVILPDSITEIQANAFTSTRSGITVTIPGKEVEINNDAFDDGEAVIRTFKNTAAATYAKTFGHVLEWIDDVFAVQFLNYDSTELGVIQYIGSGKSAVPPTNPTRTGYTFSGWSKSYNNITKDTIIIALYTINATTSGNTTTTGTTTKTTTSSNTVASNSVSANTLYLLTVESGSGDGSYKKGVPVIIKADTAPKGKVFDKWMGSTSDLNIGSSTSETTTIIMPAHEVIMIATYKDSTTTTTTGSNSSSTSVSGNSTSGNSSGSGTTVAIDKSGISNTDMASATVEGSMDNFIVKISDSDTARQEVETALLNEYGTLENISYFAMDISLYDSTGTTKITDTTGIKVNITMPIPDDLISYAGNNKAASVIDSKLDKMTPKFTSIDGVPCVTFTATHFSPYTIYVDTANLTSGITDSTPQTGDEIHPKWFLALGLVCLSAVLFLKKDKEVNLKIA